VEMVGRWGWQIGAFLSTVALMGYMVRELLRHAFKRMDKDSDIISNHITKNTETMERIVNSQNELSGRIKEEYGEIAIGLREVIIALRRENNVKSN